MNRSYSLIVSFILLGLTAVPTVLTTRSAAAGEERRAFGSWETVCASSSSNYRTCDVVQTIVSEKDASLRLTTVVTFHSAQQRYILKIATPLGLSLQDGIGLQVDDKQLGLLQFSACGKNGCLAIAEDADDLVREYIAGRNASYLLSRSRESGAFMRLPLDGFERAVLSAFSLSGDKAMAMAYHRAEKMLALNSAWFVVAFDRASRYGDCDLFLDGTPIEFEQTRDFLAPSIASLIGLNSIARNVKECEHGMVVLAKTPLQSTSLLHKYTAGAARLKSSAIEREKISAHFSALGIKSDQVVFKEPNVLSPRK